MAEKRTDERETLGQRLVRLRNASRFTQSELAERTGQSLANLRNWEYDRRTPGLWAAYRLAKVLGVQLEELAKCAEPEAAVKRLRSKRLRYQSERPKGRPSGKGHIDETPSAAGVGMTKPSVSEKQVQVSKNQNG